MSVWVLYAVKKDKSMMVEHVQKAAAFQGPDLMMESVNVDWTWLNMHYPLLFPPLLFAVLKAMSIMLEHVQIIALKECPSQLMEFAHVD